MSVWYHLWYKSVSISDPFTFHFATVKMTSESSEKFITMPLLQEMLEIHDRAYCMMMQLMMDSVKDDIKSLKQSVDEMKQNLHYTQKVIDDIKAKMRK